MMISCVMQKASKNYLACRLAWTPTLRGGSILWITCQSCTVRHELFNSCKDEVRSPVRVHADPFPILAVCQHSHTSMQICLRIPCSTCQHIHLLDMSSHILSRPVLGASDAPDLDCQKRQLQPGRAWSESWAIPPIPSLPSQGWTAASSLALHVQRRRSHCFVWSAMYQEVLHKVPSHF